jgi:hypothetical protein
MTILFGYSRRNARQKCQVCPLPYPLSSRAYPDFLLHRSHWRPLMWFSPKRTTRSRPKPQLRTGNPGKPRDLQFYGTPSGNVFRRPRDPRRHPRQTSATIRTCSGPVRQHPPIHCAPAFRHLSANSPKSLISPSPSQHRSTASHSSPELG